MTDMNIKPTVSVRKLEKYYQVVDKRYHIISGLDFEVLPGEIVSVEGASGVGKSTLLNILGAMDSFDDGEVEVCGVSLKNLTEKQRESFRAEKISFIFQQHLLLPDFTALENVMMPLLIAKINPGLAKQQATEILKKVGLGERTESFPSQLSGGESARVGVARALVGRRQLILADEPTGNLDRDNSRHLMDLIKELQNEFKFSLILVTHDLELASMAHKRNRIVSGKLTPVT
ncbi:ABC transporter ATP-binding protein [Leptospira meyeri]|uniref:Lipoprotein-releasing system ATP-binding protein n=1 Tax=Leptospira meyeri TaxID=29508 RepID=A0A4R8MNB6_LEPME|nr:ABC transporter ATP-binding protein [Leptospira meyeri]EKJ86558.1 ABC transporter, ATP-binding protein [Leptospira meyeri serovar Hardjo str. Went 5]EMJ88673.1 ABC transporter, ATP-binding protein [Leptospira meyeri serovar Semaranga str. Veldrot Semarang 173]TDY68698.1 lipoprotein-releasing system ATP-binding protein [Leptospira meyeri]TGL50200.1 ABC transporter ATP-binding protein [Leptospira meyeri]TGM25482.1 ABC transporter ATP-binding protein [Leptospira meyeri]